MASFPPIEDSILQNNPKFAALHKTLTTRILNPNGSTKSHPVQAEIDSRAETLNKQRLRATKHSILTTTLNNLPLGPTSQNDSSPPLPSELTELIILLSLQLSTAAPSSEPLSLESRTLLTTTPLYTSLLPTSLPKISALISTHLKTQTTTLARLLSPTTNPSFIHRQIPQIPTLLQNLLKDIQSKKSNLATTRLALIPLTSSVLQTHRLATEAIIQILEQTVHGALSRGAKASAELLATQAKEQQLKLGLLLIQARGAVYTPETTKALGAYVLHLRGERGRLKSRRSDAERVLWGYGVGRKEDGDGDDGAATTVGKEKVMKEIARVYGEMNREIEEVRRDVERLGST